MQFVKGERVRHPTRRDWGPGEVLEDSADDGRVRIFFVGKGDVTMVLSHVEPVRVDGAEASHRVLDELRVQHLPDRGPYRGLGQLIEGFLEDYPGGFHGERYVCTERDYKVLAHDRASELLGRDAMRAMLAGGDADRVVAGAKQVLSKTNLVHRHELMDLNDALRNGRARVRFAEALTDLLHGEGEFGRRFEGFADMLGDLGAACWPLATYFPFVADPRRHLLLKPRATGDAAEVCGFELEYRTTPNWRTYERTLAFGAYLFDALEPLSPRDMIDVQSFMWCVKPDVAGKAGRAA